MPTAYYHYKCKNVNCLWSGQWTAIKGDNVCPMCHEPMKKTYTSILGKRDGEKS